MKATMYTFASLVFMILAMFVNAPLGITIGTAYAVIDAIIYCKDKRHDLHIYLEPMVDVKKPKHYFPQDDIPNRPKSI